MLGGGWGKIKKKEKSVMNNSFCLLDQIFLLYLIPILAESTFKSVDG